MTYDEAFDRIKSSLKHELQKGSSLNFDQLSKFFTEEVRHLGHTNPGDFLKAFIEDLKNRKDRSFSWRLQGLPFEDSVAIDTFNVKDVVLNPIRL